jgi:hypothetical protein
MSRHRNDASDKLALTDLLEPLFKEQVERFVLPNGLTVVHKEDPSGWWRCRCG